MYVNSDAFTSWNAEDDEELRKKHNEEVSEATEKLYKTIIPDFAKELDENSKKLDWNILWSATRKSDIKRFISKVLERSYIHKKGINYRQLVRYL